VTLRTPVDFVPLAVFAFGALTFAILTGYYWATRERPQRCAVLSAFTLVCAVAFLDSLMLHVLTLEGGDAALPVLIAAVVRALTAGLLPALMLHLVFEVESARLPARSVWTCMVFAIYAGAVFPLWKGLEETGLVSIGWSDALFHASAALLAAATALGLAMQAFARDPVNGRDRAYRRWISLLLVLMLACAAASLADLGAIVGSLPDYLLLLFFCVTLYYRERLLFFDVLVKRGAFLAAGLMILTLWLPVSSHFSGAVYAVTTLLCWLAAPWVYGRVVYAIDRLWLRRSWSTVEADRRFIAAIQTAASENELRAQSAAALRDIFQAPAEVCLDGSSPDSTKEGLTAALKSGDERTGSISLDPRPDGIPFLSDDRKLLQSLASELSVLLENVRFREEHRRQQERERELRWLAGRAELKALRAQINPHFLFNTLSAIAGLMRDQPELADQTIEHLAHVFRYTLRKSESEWSRLSEEIEFVSAYLGIERARFGDRLQLQFDVDPAAAQVLIPAMSIQPLVENAIKHGVSARNGCGAVTLRATLDGDELSVEVFDNGPGFPPEFSLELAGNGHGLKNVTERLEGYYGKEARLSWGSGTQGTRVSLHIPAMAAVRGRNV
jgi:signal transduction histidine kinase